MIYLLISKASLEESPIASFSEDDLAELFARLMFEKNLSSSKNTPIIGEEKDVVTVEKVIILWRNLFAAISSLSPHDNMFTKVQSLFTLVLQRLC